jgi:hypothetical protein
VISSQPVVTTTWGVVRTYIEERKELGVDRHNRQLPDYGHHQQELKRYIQW